MWGDRGAADLGTLVDSNVRMAAAQQAAFEIERPMKGSSVTTQEHAEENSITEHCL